MKRQFTLILLTYFLITGFINNGREVEESFSIPENTVFLETKQNKLEVSFETPFKGQDDEPGLEETIKWIEKKITKYSISMADFVFQDVYISTEHINLVFESRTVETFGTRSITTDKHDVLIKIPISTLEDVYLENYSEDICRLNLKSSRKNILISHSIGETSYISKWPIVFSCDGEAELEERLRKAFFHLKKIAPKKKKETF